MPHTWYTSALSLRHYPNSEIFVKRLLLKKKTTKNRAENMSSSGFEWIHFSVHFDIIYTGICSSMLMNYH